jgi:hypothetical protein
MSQKQLERVVADLATLVIGVFLMIILVEIALESRVCGHYDEEIGTAFWVEEGDRVRIGGGESATFVRAATCEGEFSLIFDHEIIRDARSAERDLGVPECSQRHVLEDERDVLEIVVEEDDGDKIELEFASEVD